VTRDGVELTLLMNAGLMMDLHQLAETGASGIGLFRTELQFMVASAFPRLDEQESYYSEVFAAAGELPITFRSLDVGGDKVLPYFRAPPEENPAMGWRAIRLGLDRPALLRTQARALLKAAAGRELTLMFPMITEVSEFQRAKSIVARERAHLERHGYPAASNVRLGAMIEVPSLLWQLDELLAAVDFVSVGSNDLLQFMTATDRGNTRLASRFDALSPAFLRALKSLLSKAGEASKPVTLCGEMAGRPLEAMTLFALGFRALSMAPSAIGPVKAMLVELDLNPVERLLGDLLAASVSASDVRAEIRAYAEANRISV